MASPSPKSPRTKSKLPKLIDAYYADLKDLAHQNVLHELGTRRGFEALLAAAGREHGWTLIAEHEKKVNGKTIRPDGTFKDQMNLVRGYWEAKDTADKLNVEIEKKRKAGYPLTNIIFEDTATAVLYQHDERLMSADMKDPAKLAELITQFFAYVEPEIEEFEQAITEFKQRVPDLAEGLKTKIEQAHKSNRAFKDAFADFFELCRTSLNPNISEAAVDEMLIQHILTERLIREIFDNPEFVRRNVIAAEVEKVMLAMTSQSFDRNTYLRELDRFYVAIEQAARTMTDFADKQHFLNTVYERFFQGYSVKLADTMGIVYTPQEIVDFMCASVEEVLKTEFGKTLASDDVYIIDPCTGTGNFIVNLIRRIPKAKLEAVYKHRLFANEIMLLPYYIAALNIEHAYFEQTGNYESFEGLCFVDTLDLAESHQHEMAFMTAKNTERVERQKRTPITVIIGNPPYNVGQSDENENNKNRLYPIIDKRIKGTYVRDSRATLKTQLYDPYVKFFRWSIDRLGDRDGIVCLVSNNSFVDQLSFDGMRKHLAADFSHIYHLHLEGNVRHNPTLPGTTYNVFGIQVGVGITVAIRRAKSDARRVQIFRIDKLLRREMKLQKLRELESIKNVKWKDVTPDAENNWIFSEHAVAFRKLMPIGSKQAKASGSSDGVVFANYSGGLKTNRDDVVYEWAADKLAPRMKHFLGYYNAEVDRYSRADQPADIDQFVDYSRIKWDGTLKGHLQAGRSGHYDTKHLRQSTYRPFTIKAVYFDRLVINSVYQQRRFFPTTAAEKRIVH